MRSNRAPSVRGSRGGSSRPAGVVPTRQAVRQPSGTGLGGVGLEGLLGLLGGGQPRERGSISKVGASLTNLGQALTRFGDVLEEFQRGEGS